MHFQSLQDWLSWLATQHKESSDLGLDRIRTIAKKLHLFPINKPTIIVAGTNGKGSCVAFSAAILSAAGYKIGTYTSPHLYQFNERICCNNIPASDQEICDAFTKINALRGDIILTYFEFATLAALMIFKHANLDVLILEVGIGGRFDAVNIVDGDVAIIASIDFDHMEKLGDTREKIAYEKAGIMRSNIPAVSGDHMTPNSIKKHAIEINAHLFCYGEHYFYEQHQASWSWWNNYLRLDDLPLPQLLLQNAATVIQALQLFSLSVPITAIKAGLKQAWLPGRFQIIPGPCKIILDVAHNAASAKLLAQRLKEDQCIGKTIAIISILKDKDIQSTLLPLLNCVDAWYVASINTERGSTAEQLAEILSTLNVKRIHQFNSVTEAYNNAKITAQSNDRIVVFGSFLTVRQIYS